MAYIIPTPATPRVRLPTPRPDPFPALPCATTPPPAVPNNTATYDTIRKDQRTGIKFWIPAPKPKVAEPATVKKEANTNVPMGQENDSKEKGVKEKMASGMPRKSKTSVFLCFRCGQEGHMKRDCSGERAKKNQVAGGRPVEIQKGKPVKAATLKEKEESKKKGFLAAVKGIMPQKEKAAEKTSNRKPKGILKKTPEDTPAKTQREPRAQKTAQVPAEKLKTGGRFAPLTVEEERNLFFEEEPEIELRTQKMPTPPVVKEKGNDDRQKAIKTIKRVVGQDKVPTRQVVELAEALSKFEEAENPAVNRAGLAVQEKKTAKRTPDGNWVTKQGNRARKSA
ncbi:hypothetical protein B0H14DRAFT_3537121 [Mycena olivaceomarginata]|nr:hypothetical protein B0H14DRAFT_3537121 [Mycena olivaceomarginata]